MHPTPSLPRRSTCTCSKRCKSQIDWRASTPHLGNYPPESSPAAQESLHLALNVAFKARRQLQDASTTDAPAGAATDLLVIPICAPTGIAAEASSSSLSRVGRRSVSKVLRSALSSVVGLLAQSQQKGTCCLVFLVARMSQCLHTHTFRHKHTHCLRHMHTLSPAAVVGRHPRGLRFPPLAPGLHPQPPQPCVQPRAGRIEASGHGEGGRHHAAGSS